MTLPEDIATDQPGHAALHNETNTAVNDLQAAFDAYVVSNDAALAAAVVPTSTTAALDAIADAINTSGKRAGKAVYNTTTKKLAIADGATAAAVWVDATGATTHTPA